MRLLIVTVRPEVSSMKRRLRGLDIVILSLLILLDLGVASAAITFEASGQTQNLPDGAVSNYVDLKYLAANMEKFEGFCVKTIGTVRNYGSIFMYEDFWLQAQNDDAKIPVVTRLAGLAFPPVMAEIEVTGIVKLSTLEGGFYFLEASSWRNSTATPTPTTESTSPILLPALIPTLAAKPALKIDLSCTISTSHDALKATIKGKLTSSELSFSLSRVPISLSYSITNGASWQDLTLVYTDMDGVFGAVWTPAASGNYLLRAAVANATEYSEAETVVNLAVTPFEEEAAQNVFSVASNSTVSDLVFNANSQRLTFSVSGPNGTAGYVEVYIAKTLIDDPAKVKVYVDENEKAFATTEAAESWLLRFTYQHSTHAVTLSLAAEKQLSFFGTPLALIIIGSIIVIILAVSFVFVRKRVAA